MFCWLFFVVGGGLLCVVCWLLFGHCCLMCVGFAGCFLVVGCFLSSVVVCLLVFVCRLLYVSFRYICVVSCV